MWPQFVSIAIAASPLALYYATGRALRAVFGRRVIMLPGPLYQLTRRGSR
jgi:hypothetical protein